MSQYQWPLFEPKNWEAARLEDIRACLPKAHFAQAYIFQQIDHSCALTQISSPTTACRMGFLANERRKTGRDGMR